MSSFFMNNQFQQPCEKFTVHKIIISSTNKTYKLLYLPIQLRMPYSCGIELYAT